MVATPIPPHLIYTVFQYILPPSLPLPPHLLSRRLVQRHHFLSVSCTDAASYLCWPSSNDLEVAAALERESLDVLTSEPEHEVRYSAPDGETVLAHVRPNPQSPLQIVFSWDAETEGWRYHDARMLPFPEAASPSLDAILTNRTTVASGLETSVVFADQPSGGSKSPSSVSDNYWAGYESSGSSPSTSVMPGHDFAGEEDDKAEAAYWASYSAVHGSGDSTQPSPRLEKKLLAQNRKPPHARGPETTFDPLIAHLHLRLQQENGFISPRFTPPHSDYAQSPRSAIEGVASDEPRYMKSRPNESGEQVESEGHRLPELKDMNIVGPDASDTIYEIPNKSHAREEDVGVKEAIRGIYQMWKAHSGSGDAEIFLDIVKSAMEA